MPQLIPQVFNGGEVRIAGPFPPLHSQILEEVCDNPRSVGASVVILEDGVWSQTVEIWDCHWLQHFISIISLIASNDEKPGFSSEGDAAPHLHTAPTTTCFSIGAGISRAFSVSPPHPDPMIQNLNSSLTNVPPHVDVPVQLLHKRA
ncbi:hypothetical protein PBY51_014630 [Eleginops maclovinus]|uniref:Uncharacterized protein n=1 Tax=Eleginops maclovinus TaxID=56733 RepID=A0AAN8AB40_ELEMC|nr:hypothetical protein PBY51_014630 [Eleginops maclovinus]